MIPRQAAPRRQAFRPSAKGHLSTAQPRPWQPETAPAGRPFFRVGEFPLLGRTESPAPFLGAGDSSFLGCPGIPPFLVPRALLPGVHDNASALLRVPVSWPEASYTFASFLGSAIPTG
jgi:hypothetical protein